MSNHQGDKPESLKWRIITGVVAGVLLLGMGGGTWAVAASVQARGDELKAKQHALVVENAAISDRIQAQSDDIAQSIAEAEAAAAKAATEAAAAKAAADALAAQQAADAQAAEAAAKAAAAKKAPTTTLRQATVAPPASAGLPSGSPVPWIASSDPQDAAGGRWDTGACASNSASTGADGKAYCD
jgi:septal ring-binding cell division protein DamX